ncbi:hypothetical protein I2623_000511 [Campylobacter coli]|nr:hypothetical protein [Campylobacter coli]
MKKFILISSILSSFFIFAEANELPSDKIQPEVKVIKEHFKNKIEKIEFEAWAKLIRKTRGVKGKVEICYEGTPQKRVHKCNKF